MRCLGRNLPRSLRIPLFGDRDRWGLIAVEGDPDWESWERYAVEFYRETQRAGLGSMISDAGYRVMRRIALDEKRVVEIGPGELAHARYWHGKPEEMVLIDRRSEMLAASRAVLSRLGVTSRELLVQDGGPSLPLSDESTDVVVSFYSLEHLYPLEDYLKEISRILKPGGILVGAIPAEGGIAWGLGRYLTTRRHMYGQHHMDYDKIICWEHPNFADTVVSGLHAFFNPLHLSFWPLRLPVLDVNLIIRFQVTKFR